MLEQAAILFGGRGDAIPFETEVVVIGVAEEPGVSQRQVAFDLEVQTLTLDLVGLDPESSPSMEGQSLVPLLEKNASDPNLSAYCDSVNMLTYAVTKDIRNVKNEMLFSVTSGPWTREMRPPWAM